MQPKIVLRYRTGSKQGTSAEFAPASSTKIRFGRDSACEASFDAEKDDVVSRQHCRLDVQAGDPPVCNLTDLGSRNGTFVNRQRISGSATLRPGDVIQLGAGGPEVEFDLDPRPAPAVEPKLTRLADPPTVPSAPVVDRAAVGKATVERMILHSEKKSRKWQAVAAAAGLLVMALGIGEIYRSRAGAKADPAQGVADIASNNLDSVVFFEVGWKVVDTESGRQLFHVTMPNKVNDAQGNAKEMVPGAPSDLPIFVQVNGQLEPMLSTDDGAGRYRPIGGRHTGSGFVVSNDGFILTNRHVAATWLTRYNFADPVGVVLQFDDDMKIKNATPIGAQQFPAWVPANAQLLVSGALGAGLRIVQKSVSGKSIEGRCDYMDVTFARNRVRIPGKLARVSDQIDVAMVKIDMPRQLRKVELRDNYASVKPGDQVVILGYPSASPIVLGNVESRDGFNTASDTKLIPDPTLSVGNIGRVIRGQAGFTEATYSMFGDVYQLTVNSTGPGNSGGPVFDGHGRVIGIFTSGTTSDVKITFAVPIRYGMELMGTNRVM